MGSRITTLLLAVGIVFAAMALVPELAGLRLPGNQQGFEPQQPIAYSHRLHAGELGIDCTYCHSGVERSRHAGIPAADVCMNCHSLITSSRSAVRAEEELAEAQGRKPERVVSAELGTLYTALGLGPDLAPDPALVPSPIEWVRIHRVPDFAYFDHRPHVAAGVECQSCHGPIETMEKVRQVESLSMGWCIDCHRDPASAGLGPDASPASIDCVSCHY